MKKTKTQKVIGGSKNMGDSMAANEAMKKVMCDLSAGIYLRY